MILCFLFMWVVVTLFSFYLYVGGSKLSQRFRICGWQENCQVFLYVWAATSIPNFLYIWATRNLPSLFVSVSDNKPTQLFLYMWVATNLHNFLALLAKSSSICSIEICYGSWRRLQILETMWYQITWSINVFE